ncbi:MAG: LysR family transcriptional regulator [Heliomarina sp.]|uniref:LysR family transcriptional regulator n=1 Tax=Heliomarina sp. TaxID=2917556 RepID=UPI00405917C6
MLTPRRFLPSISSLRALEALDRLGSASAVAQELSLTQSAVSRQLQALEKQMGTEMVQRDQKRLTLTTAAKDYAAEIRQALTQITNASMRLQVQPTGGTLNLAILPTFGMRWLMPRLPEFARLHPDVTLNMATRLEPFNFATEPLDAAIYFGTDDWPGTDRLLLKHESVIAVAAPSLVPDGALANPQDILALPLLHIKTRPKAWAEWFNAQGAPLGKAVPGMIYDQFSTITQAALHGIGVALMPDYLVEQEIATSKLVPVYGGPVEMRGAYYLVWPRARANNPAVVAFREWLTGKAEPEDPLPR